MEILFGVVLLIVFILGLGIGLTIPFFVKKYVNHIEDNNFKEEKNEQSNKLDYYPTDLLKEWMTGEEVNTNE